MTGRDLQPIDRSTSDDPRDIERAIADNRTAMRDTINSLKSSVRGARSTYAPKAVARRFLTPTRAAHLGQRVLGLIRKRPGPVAGAAFGVLAIALLSLRSKRRQNADRRRITFRETVYREPLELEEVYAPRS